VARVAQEGMEKVMNFRRKHDDAYYFNWLLHIDLELQKTFDPTHENMRKLRLVKQQDPSLIASNLRRAFSGIVQELSPSKKRSCLNYMETRK
jgi:hypothetical protein